MKKCSLSLLAALLLALGLGSSALAAATMLASASPPPPVKVKASASMIVTTHMEPVEILGNKSVITVSSEIKLPIKVLENVSVEPRVKVSGPGRLTGSKMTLYALVSGFKVPVKTGDHMLTFTPREILETAMRAAKQAGLRPSGRLEALVVYTATLSTAAGAKPLIATLLISERSYVVTLTPKTGEVTAALPPPPSTSERRPSWAPPALVAGIASLLAAGLIMAYTRNEPPIPPEALAAIKLDEKIPVVVIESSKAGRRLAEKYEAPILVVDNKLCTIISGVAYCAALPTAADEPTEEEQGA